MNDVLLELYEKILAYYADQNNYKARIDNQYNCPIMDDGGYRARMVLKTKTEFKPNIKPPKDT